MSEPENKSLHVEEVELQGHIIDSLLLPKVLDEILTHGCTYTLKTMHIGESQKDPSQVRIEIRAPDAESLEEILDVIHDHVSGAKNSALVLMTASLLSE